MFRLRSAKSYCGKIPLMITFRRPTEIQIIDKFQVICGNWYIFLSVSRNVPIKSTFDTLFIINNGLGISVLSFKSHQSSALVEGVSLKVIFLHPLFGCPTANFGPWLRGQSHSPDVNHYIIQVLTRGSSGTS